MDRTSGPGPVPHRWLNCPRKSDTLVAEKFLAFKTPLSMRFQDQMPLACMFTPNMIFDYMRTIKLKIGLWFDLTNTKRFYDREEIENKGAKYVKLQCRGHGETPSKEQTQSFIQIVEEFINDRPFDVIGVHCTHGFNRTGFLIISYMVEKLDCSVEAALDAFARARPPGIYKEDYIRELYRRYEDEDDAPPAPQLPSWCFEDEEENYNQNQNGNSSRKRPYSSLPEITPNCSTNIESSGDIAANGNEIDNEDDNNDDDDEDAVLNDDQSEQQNGQNKKKKRRREMVKKNAKFMDGVGGVSLFLDQPLLSDLQAKVQDMLEWKGSGFPGSQPVSMDRMNIQFLHLKPYRVSWKADGTRYIMLINDRNEIYFFDRDFSCFQVHNLSFPKRKNLKEHITNTLLDGEMVIDKVQGKCIPRYLVYDIMVFENENTGKEKFFPTRLELIQKEIIWPRHESMRFGLINRNSEPFSVRAKDFWDLKQAGKLLEPKFARTLSHEPDGLIFQPSLEPYTPGQSLEVLKWKPLNMNSIDFKLVIDVEQGIGIVTRKIGYLYVGGHDKYFAQIKFTKALKDLNNKIIECSYENNQWVFMRERTDKSFPNSFNTAAAVWNSIKNPVTKNDLLEFIRTQRFEDDNDIMPPPPQPRHN